MNIQSSSFKDFSLSNGSHLHITIEDSTIQQLFMQPFQTTSHVGSWFPLSTLSRSERNVSIRWLLSSAFKNYLRFKRDQQDRWDLCNSIIMSFVLPNDLVLVLVPQASFGTIRANTTTERKCGTSVPLLRTSPTSKNGASILNILLTIMRMQLIDETQENRKKAVGKRKANWPSLCKFIEPGLYE